MTATSPQASSRPERLLAAALLPLTLALQVQRLAGEGWQAEGLSATLRWEDAHPSLEARFERLVLPFQTFTRGHLACPRLILQPLGCPRGRLALHGGGLAPSPMALSFRYLPPALTFSLDAIPLRRFRDLTLEGRMALSGDIRPAGLSVTARVEQGGFSDGQGLREGEAIGASLALDARREGAWAFTSRLSATEGLAYIDPFTLDLTAHPTTLDAHGILKKQKLAFDFSGHVQGILKARGQGTLSLEGPALEGLRLQIPPTPLPPFYETFLQPLLLGTALQDLRTSGRFSLQLLDKAYLSARAQLAGIALEDAGGRFGVEGLAGILAYSERGEPESRLGWERGRFYRIPFGGSQVRFLLQGRRLTIPEPFLLPVLDGLLRIERFAGEMKGALNWSFQGLLTPVSMEALCKALGWPIMGGKLSAFAPQVSYQGDRLTVEGAMLLRIFDGAVVIRHLTLDRPFGTAPTLRADIAIKGLDLYKLTQAFDFGSIQGRLDGYIKGLTLVDWEPVAFDAFLHTPEKDPSPHRISQKAVKHLAEIGGGVFAKGLLTVFKRFAYKRLGIRCRLAKGVCHMDGIAPAKKGYYIVQGGLGLPSIDVIGYTREVDWKALVERLKGFAR